MISSVVSVGFYSHIHGSGRCCCCLKCRSLNPFFFGCIIIIISNEIGKHSSGLWLFRTKWICLMNGWKIVVYHTIRNPLRVPGFQRIYQTYSDWESLLLSFSLYLSECIEQIETIIIKIQLAESSHSIHESITLPLWLSIIDYSQRICWVHVRVVYWTTAFN